MTSIKDVARHANVSIMTVSRVINHPHLVREDLQLLVRNSMKELAYTPNRAARALVSKHTGVIQVVVNEQFHKTDPYAPMLLNGISRELSLRHYSLLLLSEYNSDIACDGIIATGMTQEQLIELKKFSIPIVSFGHNDQHIPFIDIDNFTAQQQITNYCISQGSKTIVYFGIDSKSLYAKEREFGFDNAVENHDITVIKCLMQNDHILSFKTALDIIPTVSPDTIICASDMLALGVIHAAHELSVSIPNQLSITGFDGVFIDQLTHPLLTTIQQPLLEMGKALSKKLIHLIDGKEVDPETFFEPEILLQGTTKQGS